MESPALGLSLFGLLAIAAPILANARFVAAGFALVALLAIGENVAPGDRPTPAGGD